MIQKLRFVLMLLVVFLLSGFVFAGGTQESTSVDDNGIVDIKFLSFLDKFDPLEDPTRIRIKEILGVNIIPEMGNDDSKLNLIVSSGQEYDMIMSSNRDLLANFIANDAVHDLTDAVKEHGEYLTKFIPQEVWDMVSSNGRIYALPTEVEGILDFGLHIRKDWLENLGLEMPATVDEFYDVLVAFKSKDPGGVGADRVIPFTAGGARILDLGINGLTQAFGIGRSPADFVERDGRLISGLELPESKEYISFLNKLYQEGLLDADFPAKKPSDLDKPIGSGVAGVAYSAVWWQNGVKAVQAENSDAEIVFIPPFKDPDGKQRIERQGGLKFFHFVPKSSSKVEEVVKYANAFLDPANYTKLILGEEGVHHKIVDGAYYPILPAFNELNKGRWFYPANAAQVYAPLFAARAHKVEPMGSMFDDLNSYSSYAYQQITDFAPNLPEIEEFGNTLKVFIDENLMRMVIDKDALSDYDDFVAEWKALGGDELTAAYNNWYKSR